MNSSAVMSWLMGQSLRAACMSMERARSFRAVLRSCPSNGFSYNDSLSGTLLRPVSERLRRSATPMTRRSAPSQPIVSTSLCTRETAEHRVVSPIRIAPSPKLSVLKLTVRMIPSRCRVRSRGNSHRTNSLRFCSLTAVRAWLIEVSSVSGGLSDLVKQGFHL